MTHTPNANVGLGINTDFETTSAGNLFINPRTAGINGNVGINIFSPGNTLEINSNIINSSGLRFTDLNSASPALVSTSGKVLSVDINGDVFLTNDIGGNGSVSACASTASDQNFITKWDVINSFGARQICRTVGIYENPITPFEVGINRGSTMITHTNPLIRFQLQMTGNFLVHAGDMYMYKGGTDASRVMYQFGNLGYRSMAIGSDAGPLTGNTSADENLLVGRLAGRNIALDHGNTFVGNFSGNNVSVSSSAGNNYNTMLGYNSGIDFNAGDDNTLLGKDAGDGFTTGSNNVMIGSRSGYTGMTSGNSNIIIGLQAINSEATGDNNILIGTSANSQNATGTMTNAVTIVTGARVDCNNCFTIAHQLGGPTEQQVGIGVGSPAANPVATIPGVPPIPGGNAKLVVSGWNNGGGNLIAANFLGKIYSTGHYIPSDANLKDNIQPYTNAINIIDQLEAKSYEFKTNDFPTMNLPIGNQIGFMADDIAAVLPQLVNGFSTPAVHDSTGNIVHSEVQYLGVNYEGLVPILFSAIKQQEARLDSLELSLTLCCALPLPLVPLPTDGGNRSSINLSNHQSLILNQNVPNPFKDKTDITYEIPSDVNKAAILFYDFSGKILNTFEITGSGPGTLTVYGDDLTSGIYTYTLMVDGKPMLTKKMVKE